MQVSSTLNTYQTKDYNTTTKMQEELSEDFYKYYDKSNENDDSEKVKLNIFTGEFYNFSEQYNSIDEFKKDISLSEPRNLMDKLKQDSENGGIIVLGEIQQNLADYYNELDVVASFDMSVKHTNSNLTNEQINSIDVGQFFIQMLDKFNQELEDAKNTGNPQLIKQYEKIVQGYSFFNDAYDAIKTKEDENKTLLQIGTPPPKNTKPTNFDILLQNAVEDGRIQKSETMSDGVGFSTGTGRLNTLFGGSEFIKNDQDLSSDLANHLENIGQDEFMALFVSFADSFDSFSKSIDEVIDSSYTNEDYKNTFSSVNNTVSYLENRVKTIDDTKSLTYKALNQLRNIFLFNINKNEENPYSEYI